MAGAIEVRAFEVTCLPGVTPDDPQVTNLDMPVRTVLSIRVRVPSGPLSAMGFQLGMAGTPIIPLNDNTYVVADNEVFQWDNQDWPNSGAWQVFMYNIGQYPHTIYLYYTVEFPDVPTAQLSSVLLPAESLGSAVGTINTPAAFT